MVPQSVTLTVTVKGQPETWEEIEDLTSAGPEVPVPDPMLPPGTKPYRSPRVKVFALDAESGEIRFGDGIHGARPPLGAELRASYDSGAGQAGNVAAGAIATAPAGLKVTNPIPTWGGADSETVAEGEKQIAAYLRHRDRLVTASDFDTIVRRTPGVDIGRVEVVPNYNPELAPNSPGDAPGAVTLMLIPRSQTGQTNAPSPDRLFLDAVCQYLDSRRLVTTEVFLRGPKYRDIWVSIGIEVEEGINSAPVRAAVRQAVIDFLSPLPPASQDQPPPDEAVATATGYPRPRQGWPLRTAVVDMELAVVASRVSGVTQIKKILLAQGMNASDTTVSMSGLELPWLAGISVVEGDPVALAELRGTAASGGAGTTGTTGTGGAPAKGVQVPVVPEECR